jgi:hypothetical protein
MPGRPPRPSASVKAAGGSICPRGGARLLVRLDAHGVGSLRRQPMLADALQCQPERRGREQSTGSSFLQQGQAARGTGSHDRLTSLRTPDANAAAACHVGTPSPAGGIARNTSRGDAVARAHVPGRPHHPGARHATGERTRAARNLYDPVCHLHGASGGGRTWSGFCPKHSAPVAVEFTRSICARRGGSRRSNA